MITLQKSIKSTLGWCYSLGRKFLGVTPGSTFTVQAANFFAQILLILTFFLPIKVLILLGSDGVPQYFPLYLKSIKKTQLIIALSALALTCYLLYLTLELIIAIFSKKGANKLLKNNGKLVLFENQHQLSVQAYSKFTRGFSAGTFALIAFIILLYIYKLLFFAAVIYALFVTSLLITLYNKKPSIRKLISSYHSVLLNILCSLGFLVIFFCMIIDFLYLSPPKIFSALISLLLMRQGLSRLNVFMQDIISLRSQYRQINALFFHNQQLIVDTGKHTDHLKVLLGEEQRNRWIPEALERITSTKLKIRSTKWHQLGRADIYSFESEFLSSDGHSTKKYLIKLFGKNSTSLAEQERTLLNNVPTIPTPSFLGHTKVDDYMCHIFEFDNFRKLAHREIGNGVIAINENLLSLTPPDSLIKRFSRSHQYLEQRISYETIENLRIVATTEQVASLKQFADEYVFLIDTLSSLPRQIISQDTTSDTLLTDNDGNTLVSHWASWKMEPVGSNWPVGERLKLEEAVNEAKSKRSCLHDTPPAAVILCALTYAFERLCHRANYGDAIALLPDMLEQLAHVKNFRIEQRQLP